MKISLLGKGKMGVAVEAVACDRGHTIVSLEESDVCVDFSHPSAVIKNLINASGKKKNIIMGTTGWYDQMENVKKIIEEAGVGFLWSANFSLGVLIFNEVIKKASELFGKSGQYRVSIEETHHSQKVDAPSGTAKGLQRLLLNEFEDVLVSSIRLGDNPGNHIVTFESRFDTIALSHQAKSREGFALGAVIAAEWLEGKKGFFSIDDMMEDLK